VTHWLRSAGVDLVLTVPLIGAYMMFALGIVFAYRASRVLNLAHGAMATLPAYVAYALAPRAGTVFAMAAAAVAGALLGAIVERGVVRRLRPSGTTAQTVGTVAVLGFLVAVIAKAWGTTSLPAAGVFPTGSFAVGDARLQWGSLGLFAVALASAAACWWLLQRTDLGLALRGTAANPRAASLMGINPNRAAALAWSLSGLLAGAGGVLLAAATSLHPYVLSLQVLPAFVAALLGGLESITGAVWGAAVVGCVIGLVPAVSHGFGQQPGAPQLVLGLGTLVVMMVRGTAKRHQQATTDV